MVVRRNDFTTPPLPKKEENNRVIILDRVEEGWLEEDWSSTMPRLLKELVQEKFFLASKPTTNVRVVR